MAFVVEDGTGKTNSNSYADVAFADGYFADRNNDDWTGDETTKQANLILATDYIEMVYGQRFIGTRKTKEQALSWPRTNAGCFADDEIPIALQKACVEYALRAQNAPLAPDIAVDESGLIKAKTKDKVGPLEEDYAVAASGMGASVMLLKPYPMADMLLRGLVIANGRVIR